MLRSLFNREPSRSERSGRTVLSGPRIPRHSSGWAAMLKHMKEQEGLRVLDVGPTSPSNINFLTALGHSCYMADVVHEALTGDWATAPEEEGGAPGFDVRRFIDQTLDFGGRRFDVVLLWTTLDYIPQPLVQPLIDHLYAAMPTGGRVLAIFHTKTTGPNTAYCRYHLTESDTIEMQESEPHPVLQVYTNRMIEKLFARFGNYRFFLAKDNIYEVIITR
ncbi:MAG: SAM-dependent methyltransferase [Acidobacteriaceae bacterium]|nr:SAM-dependent methyltransferase [Acidobacteriaceae bacterium]